MTTLLVIDKEANTRLLLKDEFQNEGYQVTVVEAAREAIENIRQSKPDIIILGIKNPGTEDIDFLENFKVEECRIPIVVCSPYAVYRKVFCGDVCDAFVMQSADFTELKTIIKRMIKDKKTSAARDLRVNGNPSVRTQSAHGFSFLLTSKPH